jgi:hypothetical protein
VAVLVGFDEHASNDVAGHQIRRELDAGIPEVENSGKGADEGSFSESRNSFEQNVTAGNHADQNRLDHICLADYDFADLFPDASEISGGAFH